MAGRYKITHTSILGEGATAVVYKGLDTRDCRNVAVKLYKFSPANVRQQTLALEDFRKTVSVLKSLGAGSDETRLAFRRTSTTSYDADTLKDQIAASMRPSTRSSESVASSSIANPILDAIDTKCCYVRLLDHSRTRGNWAGLDENEGLLFLVMELGEESLEDRLRHYCECGKTLSKEELRQLQWTLVCICWGLHAVGFVHMDIKPQNIMRFREDGQDQWKLIDLDGAVETGTDLRFEECTFTPEYMPPELAKAWIRRHEDPSVLVTMSRLMDVWSIGMCSLEAIFLQPILRPWYSEWAKETGGDKKFFSWLANYRTDPILHGDMRDLIAGMDEDMCSLLEAMLAKDPEHRSSIAECLTHRWFQPQRNELVGQLKVRRQSMVAQLSGSGNACSDSTETGARSRSKLCTVM